jgi:hypothetical protein
MLPAEKRDKTLQVLGRLVAQQLLIPPRAKREVEDEQR